MNAAHVPNHVKMALFGNLAHALCDEKLLPWKNNTKNGLNRLNILINNWSKKYKENVIQSGVVEELSDLTKICADLYEEMDDIIEVINSGRDRILRRENEIVLAGADGRCKEINSRATLYVASDVLEIY